MFRLSFPCSHLSRAKTAAKSDYGLLGVPTTFIIDGDGHIRFQFRGYLDGAVLRRALDDVLGQAA